MTLAELVEAEASNLETMPLPEVADDLREVAKEFPTVGAFRQEFDRRMTFEGYPGVSPETILEEDALDNHTSTIAYAMALVLKRAEKLGL